MIFSINRSIQTLFFILVVMVTQHLKAQTWTPAGTSPFAPNGYSINSTSDGTSPYIVFYDKDYTYKLSVKKFNGTTWNYVGNPGFGNSAAYATIYSKGTSLYVGYLDIDAGYKLTVKKLDGTNWVTVGQPGVGPAYLSSIKLAVVKDELYASYYADSYVNVLKYDGTAWVALPNSKLSTIYDNSTIVDIAAYKDTLARLYYSLGGTNVVLQIYKNNQWSTLGKNLTSSNFFKLGVDQSNRPCVLSRKSSGTGVYMIRYNGTKWDTLGTALTNKDVHEASISFIGDIPFVILGESNSALIYPVVYKFELNAWAQFGSLKAASSDDVNITTAGNKVYAFYGQATNGTADYNTFAFVNTYSLPSQTITFPALAAKTKGDVDFNLTATASSGLPVTYTSSNTSVATVSGSTVTIIGSGVTTITAIQTGNTYYSAAPNVSQTLTVNAAVKEDQTITFTNLPVKQVGANFDPGATASSGLPVTYTISNSSVAVMIDNKIRVIGVGSTTITAVQAGNYDYNAATNVTQTMTVEKGDQTITFNALPAKEIGDESFNLTATSSANLAVTYVSSNTAVATVSGNTVTIVGLGSTTITASQAGNANYNAAPDVVQTLTVGKRNQTIYLGGFYPLIYGVEDLELAVTATSGLPVVYTSSNPDVAIMINGNILRVTGVGTTTISVSQPGDAYYNPALTVSTTLTVVKGYQEITFDPLPDKTFGDGNFDIVATTNSGLPITFTSSNTGVAKVNGNTITIVGGGSTWITASQAGNDKYNPAISVQQIFAVNSATQTITFDPIPMKSYGDVNFDLTATASSGLPVTYLSDNPDVAYVVGNTVNIVGVGEATITASQAGNNNYLSVTGFSQVLVVGKGSQTITFDALPEKNMGDGDFILNASASSDLYVNYKSSNPAVATVSWNIVTIVGVGTTVITVSQTGNSDYNAAADVSQTLTINPPKQNQIVTFTALPAKSVGDANFDLTATASSGLGVTYTSSNPAVATVSGNTVTIVGAGSTTIAAFQTGNANYNAADVVTQTLTVEKGGQTITFGALSAKSVGDANFDLTATTSSGLAVTYTSSNPAVATISGNTITIVGAGSATITASQTGNANYNAASDVTQTLNINPPKQNQIVTFTALPAKSVGDANFDLTATASSGLAVTYTSSNPAVATVSGNTVTIIGAGSTTITASQAGDANYNAASDVTQTLTVENSTATSTTTALASNAAELFPNPAFNKVAIQFQHSFEYAHIKIYTLEGNVVYATNLESVANDSVEIYVNMLPEGMYVVEIKTDQGILVKRLAKQ